MTDWAGLAATAHLAPMPDPSQAWGLGDSAALLTELGIPVFPLPPGSKQPHPGSRGCKDATTDTERVRRWWGTHPGDNIGIATGHGLDVLDVDCKNGQPGHDTLRRLAPLLPSPAVVVRTPSGGLHLWYRSSGDGNHAGLAGLDYRGQGGYVLAPGSATPEGRYEWVSADDSADTPAAQAPPWTALQTALRHQPHRPDPATPAQPGQPSGAGLEALQRHVSRLPEGNRNAGLYWAARRAVADGYDPDRLTEAARACGLPDHEIRATLASARKD